VNARVANSAGEGRATGRTLVDRTEPRQPRKYAIFRCWCRPRGSQGKFERVCLTQNSSRGSPHLGPSPVLDARRQRVTSPCVKRRVIDRRVTLVTLVGISLLGVSRFAPRALPNPPRSATHFRPSLEPHADRFRSEAAHPIHAGVA